MNRRDLIIVAVIINAAVLTLLFVTAIRSDDAEMATETTVATAEPFAKELTPMPVMGETTAPSLFHAQTPAPNFLEEIRSISTLEPQGSMHSLTPVTTDSTTSLMVAPAPVQESAAQTGFVEIKVKRGDVLERLARHHNSSVGEIMKMNNLSSSRLKIGQVLKIPTKQKTVAAVASAPQAVAAPVHQAPAASAEFYVVKPGDNAWTIAVRNHLKVDDLLKLNNLTEEKARRLKPGDKLRVR